MNSHCGTFEADPAVRCRDTLAQQFLPQPLRLFGSFSVTRDMVREAIRKGTSSRLYGFIVARTRFLDTKLQGMLDKRAIQQLVVLGAGFDSRAYRFPLKANGVRAFEVDLPVTSTDKQAAVRRIGIDLALSPVTYVQADFSRQSLATELAAAGFDKTKPTFFIWEGVTMYLEASAVHAVLQYVGSCAPGTSIAFDFLGDDLINQVFFCLFF